MKRKTELLIEMAREVYAENQNFGHIAGTYETLRDVCNENFRRLMREPKLCFVEILRMKSIMKFI